MELNKYPVPSWAVYCPHSHDPLDTELPSDEALIEAKMRSNLSAIKACTWSFVIENMPKIREQVECHLEFGKLQREDRPTEFHILFLLYRSACLGGCICVSVFPPPVILIYATSSLE